MKYRFWIIFSPLFVSGLLSGYTAYKNIPEIDMALYIFSFFFILIYFFFAQILTIIDAQFPQKKLHLFGAASLMGLILLSMHHANYVITTVPTPFYFAALTVFLGFWMFWIYSQKIAYIASKENHKYHKIANYIISKINKK